MAGVAQCARRPGPPLTSLKPPLARALQVARRARELEGMVPRSRFEALQERLDAALAALHTVTGSREP